MPGPMAEVTIRIGTGLLAGLPVCRLKCLLSCCLALLLSWPMAVLIHWWPYAFSPWIYSFFPPLLLRPAPLNTAVSGSFGNSAHSIQGEESDNQGCVSPWKKRMLFFFPPIDYRSSPSLFFRRWMKLRSKTKGAWRGSRVCERSW